MGTFDMPAAFVKDVSAQEDEKMPWLELGNCPGCRMAGPAWHDLF